MQLSGNNCHRQAVEETYEIIERFEDPMNTVQAKMNDNLKEKHQVYPKTVEALAPAIHLLGKQRLALRKNTGKACRMKLRRIR